MAIFISDESLSTNLSFFTFQSEMKAIFQSISKYFKVRKLLHLSKIHCGKVMFLHLSVILFGGASASGPRGYTSGSIGCSFLSEGCLPHPLETHTLDTLW